MSNTLKAMALLGVVMVARRVLPHRVREGSVALAIALWVPWAALVVVPAALGARVVWLRRSRRRAAGRAILDVLLLGELTGLGLSAGLTLPGALQVAGREVGGAIGAEVRDVLRQAARLGAAPALELASGAGRSLYRVVGRAVATGAPAAGAVEAWLVERRGEDRATQLTKARKLPVRLLFPLALLILPGFLVLTVGPALLGAVDRLGL